jgi:hypothetical protein
MCYMLSREDLYDPCLPTLVDGRISMMLANFVTTLEKNNPLTSFRNLNWSNNVETLESIVGSKKRMVFGHNDYDQIDFLKSHFPNNVFSIACTYKYYTEDYDVICRWLSLDHVNQQRNGTISVSDFDHGLKKTGVNLLKHYYQHFLQIKFIPEETGTRADYCIPIKDLFDKKIFFKHITNLEGTISHSVERYYDAWYSYNNIKDLNYENI